MSNGVLRHQARRALAALAVLLYCSVPGPCLAESSGTAFEAAIEQATKLLVRAQGLIDLDLLKEGESEVHEAVAALNKLPNTNPAVIFGYANCDLLLGNLANRRGNAKEALRLWGEAVSRYEMLEGAGPAKNLVATWKEMAALLINTGQLEPALAILKSIDDAQEASPPAVRATNKNDLGVMLQRLGRQNEAEEQLKQAVTLSEGSGSTPEKQARFLFNLALTEQALHHSVSAAEHLRRCLKLLEGIDNAEESRGEVMEVLAQVLNEEGDRNGALNQFTSALDAIKGKSEMRELRAQILNDRGICLLDSGRTSEALDSLLLSLNNAWTLMMRKLPSMTQRQALDRANRVARRANLIYSIALTSPKDMGPRAYDALLQTKALFTEVTRLRQERLLRAVAPSAAAARERYFELRRRISRRTLDFDHSEVPTSQEVLAQMALEADLLERKLLEESTGMPSNWEPKPVLARQVWSRLRPGEVLIDYFTYSSVDLKSREERGARYGAFVVHPGGGIEAFDLGESTQVVNVIEAFRNLESRQEADLTFNEDDLARLGESVRRLILDPALPSRDSLKRLYVAPAGILGLLPFDALPLSRGARGWTYLVEGTDVVHLLSGRELTRNSATQSHSSAAWLIGNPDFRATPSQRIEAFNSPPHFYHAPLVAKSRSSTKPGTVLMVAGSDEDDNAGTISENWNELEGTGALVDSVAQTATKAGLKARVFLGAAASEENFSLLSSPRLLLLASHGYFLKKTHQAILQGSINFSSSSKEPLTAMAREDVGPGENPNSIVVDNPDFWQAIDSLQRSMIILAGANHRAHQVVRYLVDGRLLSADETAKPPAVGQKIEREIGDGLLTAYKVLGVDLTATELVVLAGCESGVGVSQDSTGYFGIREDTEGVIGLEQAFTMVGTRTVVASLWKVPLDNTIQQMREFLDAWLARERPRYEAFHDSQLSALRDAREKNIGGSGGHPFWWAGFIYVGDPGDR